MRNHPSFLIYCSVLSMMMNILNLERGSWEFFKQVSRAQTSMYIGYPGYGGRYLLDDTFLLQKASDGLDEQMILEYGIVQKRQMSKLYNDTKTKC